SQQQVERYCRRRGMERARRAVAGSDPERARRSSPFRFVRAFAAALSLVVASAVSARSADPAADRRINHVLDRFAFGPSLEDFRHVKAIGVGGYIVEQLYPATVPEPIELGWRLAQLGTLRLDAVQLRQLYGPLQPVLGVKPTLAEVRDQQQRARIVSDQAAAARIYRGVLSKRQLLEVMVDFWFNHFNIFEGKGLDQIWIGNYEETIRQHAFGRFRDLLFAVAKHPA